MDLLRYRLSGNPRLTGEQMLESLPEIAKVARVEVDKGNPYDQGSYEALRKLALRAEQVLQSPDVDGLVYVQGTNNIEETAYFLSLTVHSDKPIVVTGAQPPYNALSSDAQMNLLDAVRLACAPASRGKGAVVAFNGEIDAAREVTKTNTYHLQTFRTRDLGLRGCGRSTSKADLCHWPMHLPPICRMIERAVWNSWIARQAIRCRNRSPNRSCGAGPCSAYSPRGHGAARGQHGTRSRRARRRCCASGLGQLCASAPCRTGLVD